MPFERPARQATPRATAALADLEATMERVVNVILEKLGEPLLTLNEAIGLQLYTRPLYATQHSTTQNRHNSSQLTPSNAMLLQCCTQVCQVQCRASRHQERGSNPQGTR